MNDANLSNDEIDSLLDGLDEEAPVASEPSAEDSEEVNSGKQVSIELDDLSAMGLSEDGDSSDNGDSLMDMGLDLDTGDDSTSSSSSTPSSFESNSGGLDLSDLSEFGLEDSSSSTNVKKVNFGNLNLGNNSGESSNIDMLLDVPMDITVELGRAVRKVSDILSLNVGAVVELNKLSGEPVELLVNGKVIALAEVVVIDENFGVRITEIIDPQDRVKFE